MSGAGDRVTIRVGAARALCEAAAARAGARTETARAIAAAAVHAEAVGQSTVGLSHYLDYLDALGSGRLDGANLPVLSRPAPAVIRSDAAKGAAHTGFDMAFDDLVATARTFGLALFAQRNAFTCGALGWFVERLAHQGLVGLAATNGPALLAGSGGTKPVYCTNPLAFAAPIAEGPPLLIDQASSATAFVSIRRAAEEGRNIPSGWAVDAEGRPTTDPASAMAGALLAFGGDRGANVALMVEVLAAGMTGANWSLDAPSFRAGTESPGSGLFVLALDPAVIDPDFPTRMAAQAARLAGHGVHVPGQGTARRAGVTDETEIAISRTLLTKLAGDDNGVA